MADLLVSQKGVEGQGGTWPYVIGNIDEAIGKKLVEIGIVHLDEWNAKTSLLMKL